MFSGSNIKLLDRENQNFFKLYLFSNYYRRISCDPKKLGVSCIWNEMKYVTRSFISEIHNCLINKWHFFRKDIFKISHNCFLDMMLHILRKHYQKYKKYVKMETNFFQVQCNVKKRSPIAINFKRKYVFISLTLLFLLILYVYFHEF